jgi:tetratricopeptide (TPR) repeat protein
MVLPVLRASSEPEVEEALGLVPFLREKMMPPSLSFPPSPRLGEWARRLDLERGRLLLEDPRGPLENLFCHDLLDEMLNWSLSSKGGFCVEPCRSLILDQTTGMARVCPWDEWKPWADVVELASSLCTQRTCQECWEELPPRMEEAIRWNKRQEEGGRIRHQLGVFAMSRGDAERAELHLSAGLQMSRSPQLRSESLLYLGLMRLEQGRIQEAQEVLEQARRLNQGSGTILYHLARCQFAWKDYIEAADLFREALAGGVEQGIQDQLLLQLAICHIHLEEFQEAWEALGRVEMETPPVCFYRGMALLGQGSAGEALGHFRQALDMGPDSEDMGPVLFYLAHCLKELGRFEEAIDWVEKALEAEPGSYEAWNLLGYCRFKLGLHHDSIGAFLKALEINPGSAIDMANIGSNLRELGDKQGALTWYRRALALDPTLGFAAENARKIGEGEGKERRGERGREERRVKSEELRVKNEE